MWTVAQTASGWRPVEVNVKPDWDNLGFTWTGNVDPRTRREMETSVSEYLKTWSVFDPDISSCNTIDVVGYFIEFLPNDGMKRGSQLALGLLGAIIAETLHVDPRNLTLIGGVSATRGLVPGPDDEAAVRAAPRHHVVAVCSDTIDVIQNERVLAEVGFLKDIVDIVRNPNTYPLVHDPQGTPVAARAADFSEVKGQDEAKWWAFIAAAGRHNILLAGPPGQGKSLLASAMPTLLPRLTRAEVKEIEDLYSRAGIIRPDPGVRPVQSVGAKGTPAAALFGGGSDMLSPGAVSLAHLGILHIDEFLELTPARIESLRTVMEERVSHIVRVRFNTTLPADFMLVATCNRCPCGRRGHPALNCRCTDAQIRRYVGRMSAAIADRIDITQHTTTEDVELVLGPADGWTSAQIRPHVTNAWKQQWARYGPKVWNSTAPGHIIQQLPLEKGAKDLLHGTDLSPRGVTRALRLARTIGDVYTPGDPIRIPHLKAAIASLQREV